ncbi:MAG: 2-hydroxyglutaryl-CoA dehydratase [Candidatus Cloacimonetes bacterium]|nr:2-hydroxyglutaryl-CoA dehydratase [Candidatus Cloacimonadota bacterium]
MTQVDIKPITAGIDVGSRTTKLVIQQAGKVLRAGIRDTGINPRHTARDLYEEVLRLANLKQNSIARLVATGYGRNIVDFSIQSISEISCQARGVRHLLPHSRTVIDIGGQDSKIILLNEQGRVDQFFMNDKCAAGTGRFLEVVATILGMTLDEISDLQPNVSGQFEINSTCVVFAESEIIGLLSKGERADCIVEAVNLSIARRIRQLLAQSHWQPPVVFTGGVALNKGMVQALGKILDSKITIPENSSITGALGASLLAEELN